MAHVALFLIVLALLIKVPVIFQLFQYHRKYGYRYLKIYAYIFLIGVLDTLLILANNYIFTNMYARFKSIPAVYIEIFYRVLYMSFKLFLIYLFILLVRELLQKKTSSLIKTIYPIISGVIFVGIVAVMVYGMVKKTVMPVLWTNVVISLFFAFIILGSAIYLFFSTWEKEDQGKRKAVRIFALIYIVRYVILLILSVFHLFFKMSSDIMLIFSSPYSIMTCTAILIYINRFIQLYHGTLDTPLQNDQRMEILFEKYHISKREQDVVRLICAGKTNKEIEADLYISLQTVKDHVSSIFKKTGVRNRVQLVNLFRQTGQTDKP
jgi:DNA-binding CsgD family transcriptional regulator